MKDPATQLFDPPMVPPIDFVLNGLIDNLEERGQLDETLVGGGGGEFGRTPRHAQDGGVASIGQTAFP